MNAMSFVVDQLTKEPTVYRAKKPSKMVNSLMDEMVAHCREHGRTTVEAMADALCKSPSVVQKAAREMASEGRLSRELVGTAFIYFLPKVARYKEEA